MTGPRAHTMVIIPAGWWDNARCRNVSINGTPFDEVKRKYQIDRARNVCERCPVQRQCLDEAMALEAGVGRDYIFGFRGGMTRKERHLLQKEAS